MTGRRAATSAPKPKKVDNTYKKRRGAKRNPKSSQVPVVSSPSTTTPLTSSTPTTEMEDKPLDLTVPNRFVSGQDLPRIVYNADENLVNPVETKPGGSKIRRVYTSSAREDMPFFTSSYFHVLTATTHRGCQTDLTAPKVLSARPPGSSIVAVYFTTIPKKNETKIVPETSDILSPLLSASGALQPPSETTNSVDCGLTDPDNTHPNQPEPKDPVPEPYDKSAENNKCVDDGTPMQPQLFALETYMDTTIIPSHGQNLAIKVPASMAYGVTASPVSTEPPSPVLCDEDWNAITDALGVTEFAGENTENFSLEDGCKTQ
jgi:hypothetical protein